MEKLIAYRDKDADNDIWSERAFLFKTNEDVKDFFRKENPYLLSLYTDNFDEEDNELMDFEINDQNPAGLITSISFRTQYAGKVFIAEMSEGYLINY